MPSSVSAGTQSIASAMPGGFCRSRVRSRGDRRGDLLGQRRRWRPGTRRRTIADRPLERRVVDPVVEAAALERVVQVAGAVGGEHDDRRERGRDGADLGDGDGRLGQQLEQERLELVVGAVDLVDQQHGRPRAGCSTACSSGRATR